ncbi:1,3-beta-glucanosyltransferase [Mortierella sp. AD011]|nr:1,3-beta-glucanosyltransferase [Mortierella sp. AD010]KAF9402912.1 1,3-beta-glucanosyltransferase [Mortierella sp. AD011]
MKFTALVSLAAAVLAFTEASTIKVSTKHGHAVPLSRNPNYKHNTKVQINKMRARYGRQSGVKILDETTATVPLINFNPDIEYYGNVSVGTPAQVFRLDFDTGSSDIWFPSSTCTTSGCKAHNRFDAAKSSTYKKDGRTWNISYEDKSGASGILGSDIVNVGGVSVRQTIGLATAETTQFTSEPNDGLFGLAFSGEESVRGVKTFMDNAIAAGALAQPVVSVFLPSLRRNGGTSGEYLFGGIDSTKYSGDLTYIKIPVDDITYNGSSLGLSSDGIVDTGTTLVMVGTKTAKAIHDNIQGAVFTAATSTDPAHWVIPCSLQSSTDNVGFSLGGKIFNVPIADIAYEALDDGSGNCYSGIQGNPDEDNLWILGDVFIKNNYCVFDHGATPRVGIAPLNY